MKFGKRIIIINSLIIALLTAVIMIAMAIANRTVFRANIRNTLVDTVSARAAILSASDGIVPDNFDYDVGGVYLSIYLSDGSLKNGSFPAELELPINKGVITTVNIEGDEYYVYDFAVSLEGRDDIYLRGIVSSSYGTGFIATLTVTIMAGLLAIGGILKNILSEKKAVQPIDKMRREVNDITETRDISKRLTLVPADDELNRLAEDYNYMLDSLEAMFRNQERFTSDVAHELRTPLTVILSESEYALDETSDTDEKNASLETIVRQSKRLKAITDSLLEFTRYANKLSIELKPVNISAVTEEFIDDFAFPQKVKCHIDIEKDITVSADVTLFERVLQNLLDNAVKYGKEDGNITVVLKNENDKITLTVSDDGMGMSEETLAHVYDRFYQADPSRSNKSGLGLGLSLVKEIIRLFGARIEIKSTLGKGTSVILNFSAAAA